MNITQLRSSLIETFNSLRAKEIGLNEAKELANTAGKIVSTAKVQLEYNKWCGSKKEINFLKGD